MNAVVKGNWTDYVGLMRPQQYVKNTFILLPLFFGGQITNGSALVIGLLAFVAFSISSSAVYIFNDYRDIEDDRGHPKKKNRPLASGAVKPQHAIVQMMVLALLGLGLMLYVSLDAAKVLALYMVINFAYSVRLKHMPIVDVCIIGIGFNLRLFVGAFASGIALSMWIVVMTFLLAMFLALAKRRDDLVIYENTGAKMRKVIDGYNFKFVEGAMMVMASVVIVSYIMYATSAETVANFNTPYLYLTVFFVIVGILRYMQIAFVENDSGSPTRVILRDPFTLITVMLWFFSFIWIIYR